jgi:hypothetical protein
VEIQEREIPDQHTAQQLAKYRRLPESFKDLAGYFGDDKNRGHSD